MWLCHGQLCIATATHSYFLLLPAPWNFRSHAPCSLNFWPHSPRSLKPPCRFSFLCLPSSAVFIVIIIFFFKHRIWLGGSDSLEERNWRWTDGYLLTWANWMDAKPNGDTSENCMIRMTSGEWDDDLCSGSYQYYCENVTGLKCLVIIKYFTLFSKRSAHWFHPVRPVTPGHRPWPQIMSSLSNGLRSNVQKTLFENSGWATYGLQEIRMIFMCKTFGKKCRGRWRWDKTPGRCCLYQLYQEYQKLLHPSLEIEMI